MKKIIAISVMFALVIGAAFADTSFGAAYGVKADLFMDKAQAGGDDAGTGNYGITAARVDFNWEGDNTGAKVRLDATQIGGWWGSDPFAFGWWKPIDQFKFQIGHNADGNWGTDTITGWGFNGGAQDFVALDNGDIEFGIDWSNPANNKGLVAHIARGTGFGGSFGEAGAALFITPADGVEIGVGIPLAKSVGGKAYPTSVVFSNSTINVKADIPNIGTAKLALKLNKGDLGTDTQAVAKDADLLTEFYLAFYLSAIENMGVDFGVAVKSSGNGSGKKNDQIELGIGYTYSAGDLGLKARLGVIPKWGDGNDTIPLGIELLPYYNLGSLTAYVNVGFGTAVKVGKGDSAGNYSDFYFNPYVQVPISGGNFWAGVKFWQASKMIGGGTKPDANWSIPIGLNFDF